MSGIAAHEIGIVHYQRGARPGDGEVRRGREADPSDAGAVHVDRPSLLESAPREGRGKVVPSSVGPTR
jgi:hypothetical protein